MVSSRSPMIWDLSGTVAPCRRATGFTVMLTGILSFVSGRTCKHAYIHLQTSQNFPSFSLSSCPFVRREIKFERSTEYEAFVCESRDGNSIANYFH